MDGWDALQAYDLVNDGGGNYGFVRGPRDNKFHLKEGIGSIFTLFKLDEERKRRSYEERLDKP